MAEKTNQGQGQGQDQEFEGIVRNVATFNQPLHATLEGEPVRILAIGDQEGKSPVYLAVDASGMSRWGSLKNFRIIDLTALPTSMDALQNATAAVAARRTTQR